MKDNNDFGLIHIYCGDGKGKTTAALGLCLRAAGRGKSVLFVQFLKGGISGELNILPSLPQVKVMRLKKEPKYTFLMNPEELASAKLQNMSLLEEAFLAAEEMNFDMIVLDEGLDGINYGVLDEDRFRHLIENRPPNTELIITGRMPSRWILEIADYVTDMEKIKHPFDLGIEAREGIEL